MRMAMDSFEYARRSESGLIQQGWKDSWDSVFHAGGTLAEPPIAQCEIQGSAYAAWTGAARLAAPRGDAAQARRWKDRAPALQTQFERASLRDRRDDVENRFIRKKRRPFGHRVNVAREAQLTQPVERVF
jgi:glycogen debranching enzyme